MEHWTEAEAILIQRIRSSSVHFHNALWTTRVSGTGHVHCHRNRSKALSKLHEEIEMRITLRAGSDRVCPPNPKPS
jgi:ribulose-5-phosphate 4-epimerase/fuculose-1-phosphate aldolase